MALGHVHVDSVGKRVFDAHVRAVQSLDVLKPLLAFDLDNCSYDSEALRDEIG